MRTVIACDAVTLPRGVDWARTDRPGSVVHIAAVGTPPLISLCAKPACYPINETMYYHRACPKCVRRSGAVVKGGAK